MILKKIKPLLFLISVVCILPVSAQNNYPQDPKKAKFVTADIDMFWQAFDKMDTEDNPFIAYLENGSDGLKDFIPNRIESPAKLLKVVKRRRPDYEAIRENSLKVVAYTEQIQRAYQVFSEMYASAVFPPTYFVIGAFNTGGTAAASGLIIGVEKQEKIAGIPYVVAHEIIHFNQNYPKGNTTLLEQSIVEGSADFIGELISGKHPNELVFDFGNANEALLCSEFVEIMHGGSYRGWLYGSKGKKKGRPQDLGYWMGYKICQAYYDKAVNKEAAVKEILNIKNMENFLEKSGYLKQYIIN